MSLICVTFLSFAKNERHNLELSAGKKQKQKKEPAEGLIVLNHFRIAKALLSTHHLNDGIILKTVFLTFSPSLNLKNHHAPNNHLNHMVWL